MSKVQTSRRVIHSDTHSINLGPRWTVAAVATTFLDGVTEPELIYFECLVKNKELGPEGATFNHYPLARWNDSGWDPDWWVPTAADVPSTLLVLVERLLSQESQGTTQDTLTDRTVSAMTEAIMVADSSATWLRSTAEAVLAHLAAELIALEQLHGRPLTLQDAAAFLCAEMEA